MITIELPNDAQLGFGDGAAIKLSNKAPIIQTVSAVENILCFCPGCQFELKVFALPGGEDYQNDKTPLLLSKSIASDTIAFELIKNGVKVADLNDNTLGTYYSTFAAQPLYTAFVVDWSLVFTAHQAGRYQIRAVQNIVGEDITTDSQFFRLCKYNDRLADNTIKIQAVHSGNHVPGLNYKDLIPGGWVEEYRLTGRIAERRTTSETNIYLTNDYVYDQIKGKENIEYVLEVGPLPIEAWQRLTDIDVMATEHFYVTDYAVLNDTVTFSDKFKRLDLIKKDIDKESFITASKFTMTMSPRVDNNIMSNF